MVFYHVYVANNWEEVVCDQLSKLIFSGLYREAAAIHVGIAAKERRVRGLLATRSHRAV